MKRSGNNLFLNNTDERKPKNLALEDEVLIIDGRKFIDTGGGFLLDVENQKEKTCDKNNEDYEDSDVQCTKCNEQCNTSYLFKSFDLAVCDNCRPLGEYELIPKSDAMNEYLLSDVDLSRRDPPLKFVTRPNPHNVNWGQMKLYLRSQVEKRALEKWGSMDKINEAHSEREAKRLTAQTKKYKKNLNELRKNVRSSFYKYGHGPSHQHIFSNETYNASEDNYTRKCDSCGFVDTFEKM